MADYHPDPGKAQPTVGGGGLSGDTDAGVVVSICIIPRTPPAYKPQLTDLQALAQEALDAGDRKTFWALRRCYLLAQAAIYAWRHGNV